EKSLIRLGKQQEIALKELRNSSKEGGSWLNEVISHFSIDKIAQYILPCYGITRNPENGDF
ncbi:15706_t:CDS:2, partial [Racocetra persica]